MLSNFVEITNCFEMPFGLFFSTNLAQARAPAVGDGDLLSEAEARDDGAGRDLMPGAHASDARPESH